MKTFDELVKTLNELKITQKSIDWIEDLPKEVYEEYFNSSSKEEAMDKLYQVADGLDVDKHRWYETSIAVYKYQDRFLGVESVTDLFSESMDVEDCFHTVSFFEMKEKTKITYKKL